DGTKVRKVFGGKTTDYLDGFQYENGVLQFVPTSEGYYDVVKNKYIYNYTDHLGNVRLSYTKGASGGAEIIEENNYYPFGLKHQGYNSTSLANNAYQYKYNGKELQETGMYDYGARMYMPELGRWGVVDPLSEMYYNYTPYNYAAGNPIKYTDPNGMWISIIDGNTTYRYDNGKLYTQNTETKKWDVEAKSIATSSYAGQILSALTSMTGNDKDSFGSKLLGMFSNDKINTSIQSSSNFEKSDYQGKNFTMGEDIYTGFNQEVTPYTSMYGEKSQKVQSPFYVSLFHEIGHSWLNQITSRSELSKIWVDGSGNNLSGDIKQSEIAASYIENLLRSEQGLPIRTSYSPDADKASTLIDFNSIKWSPSIRGNTPGNTQINVNTRVFTMPNSVQTIYNKIMNSK
ncbi:RHS repeat-associated core domain-containing protein, partial [Elizabethkingia anophelis]|uniref:RHS repeat-associated core domain-containing protein n=1 Tax=Elizabethkingia anophelis TaxID=1117645 RepID=UPI0038917951